MARANKKPQLIEFKGMTLPVLSVTLHSLQTEALTLAATELFGDEAFFDGDAAVLELDLIAPPQADENLNWASLLALFTKHGLRIIGVRGGSEALRESAASAGLPNFAPFKRPSRNTEESAPATTIEGETEADGIPVLLQDSPPPVVQQAPAPATLLIDRPLRSGQQAYARGGDLVVLAAVNAGAEVIADGSIHIYAPLRGRALAGANGDSKARIFTTRFEAELVSIAGVYRTFENGIPDQLAGLPVQVQLAETNGETSNRLSIEALKTN